MSSKILLVLGAGKNIGAGLAKGFSAAGYKVALVSRHATDGLVTPEGYLTIQADLKQSSSIPSIFNTVKKTLGGPPNVVVYNAAALTPPPEANNPFSIPLEALEGDLAVMNSSAYLAAREAVTGFDGLSKDTPKAFIYTGNALSARILPGAIFTTLGTGKSAASYWIGMASGVYKDKGYKFYYADQRKEDGESVNMSELSGPAAAEFYLQLVDGKGEIPWHATFVAWKGFVDFPSRRT